MDLSIIIVSWNTRDILAKSLNSVYVNPPSTTFEVWVVDNASQDGSAEMVRECYPQVHLIENSENLGFAKANNKAIRRSNGSFVLLLNSDTEVQPGSLDELLRFMKNFPDTGIAGAKLLFPSGLMQVSGFPRPTLFRELWRMFHLDKFLSHAIYNNKYWQVEQPREVDVLMGACMMLRRKALEQVGLLDEDYFFYSEEVDLCYRMQKKGWRLYWVPQAKVTHHHGQSVKIVPAEMFLLLYQGKVLFFRKHYSWLTVKLYKIVLFLSTLVRLLLTPITLIQASNKRVRNIALSNNYRRLLIALPEM